MKELTLLEKAKNLRQGRRKNKITDEHIELGIAWLKDEISLSQVARAVGKNTHSGHILYYIASWVREGYRKGKIKEVKK